MNSSIRFHSVLLTIVLVAQTLPGESAIQSRATSSALADRFTLYKQSTLQVPTHWMMSSFSEKTASDDRQYVAPPLAMRNDPAIIEIFLELMREWLHRREAGNLEDNQRWREQALRNFFQNILAPHEDDPILTKVFELLVMVAEECATYSPKDYMKCVLEHPTIIDVIKEGTKEWVGLHHGQVLDGGVAAFFMTNGPWINPAKLFRRFERADMYILELVFNSFIVTPFVVISTIHLHKKVIDPDTILQKSLNLAHINHANWDMNALPVGGVLAMAGGAQKAEIRPLRLSSAA